jgi:hypothetical protein
MPLISMTTNCIVFLSRVNCVYPQGNICSVTAAEDYFPRQVVSPSLSFSLSPQSTSDGQDGAAVRPERKYSYSIVQDRERRERERERERKEKEQLHNH